MADNKKAGGGQNSPISHTHEDYDVAQKTPYDVEKKPENENFSLPHENTPLDCIHISGHRLRIRYKMYGIPRISPTKKVKMRNWVKCFWNDYNGVNIVSNLHVLEVFVKVGKRKKGKIVISTAWNNADLARRKFSEWQKIGLTPIKTAHPLDLASGHYVIEGKKLKKYLKNEAGKLTSEKIGLVFDKSHAKKPEFTGENSAEGALGADYLFLDYPTEFRGVKARIERMEAEFEAHKQNTASFEEDLKAQLGLMEGENRILAESSAKNLEGTTEIMRILRQRGRRV